MSDPILNDSGMTELHLAAYHGNLDWVRHCIQNGLDVNARTNGGFTPLHWVADMGMVGPDNGEREEIVRLLIEAGADIEAKNVLGESVLFRAVMAGNCQIVEILIGVGADINATDNRGDKPLAIAVAYEDAEMVALLERAGSPVNSSE